VSFFGDAPAELLYAMPSVGGAVTCVSTVTSGTTAGGPMLGGGGAGGTYMPCEIPHNYFSKQGKSIMWHASGMFTLPVVAIPAVRLSMYLDSTPGTAATLLCQTGLFASSAVSTGITGQWSMQGFATCTAPGTSGTLQAFGLVHWGPAQLTTSAGVPDYTMGVGTTTPVTFNTYQTTPVYLDPLAWWSVTTSSPTLTMTQYFVWGLN
jgi:hypothetical protein